MREYVNFFKIENVVIWRDRNCMMFSHENLANVIPDAKPSSDDVKLTRVFAKTRMKIKKESRGNHSTITIRKIDFKSGI